MLMNYALCVEIIWVDVLILFLLAGKKLSFQNHPFIYVAVLAAVRLRRSYTPSRVNMANANQIIANPTSRVKVNGSW
jgi:hypothetical protein